MLEEKGLIVREEVIKRYNNEVDIDRVYQTDPKANSTVKEGSKVTIYVSLGSKQVEIENYVGKNYLQVKAVLEEKGLNVNIEKEEIDDKNKYKENIIIKQDIAPLTKLEDGDTITLTIQELYIYYPDFTNYTLSQVKDFCNKHKVELDF